MCKDFFKSQIIRVKIKNKTLKIKDCKWVASLIGLMFDSMNNIDGALVYSNNIWMPFVKKKLDLIFLDKKFKVIDVKKAVPLTIDPRTWRAYINWKAGYCLEIKSGLVNRNLINRKISFC